jgi:TolB-like protein/class 3 adenylate cyclase
LVAIVAADISEFSRLVGEDEEGTLAAIQSIRSEIVDPLLGQHNGRIANTAGDSMLIEFQSAVEAVRFATELNRQVAKRNAELPENKSIFYRVGINVGDVVRHDQDLLGDGVNVAARLEALAPPGGIVLSRTARDQVRDRLDLKLDDLGEVKVKNIARPVRAFQISDREASPARHKRSSNSKWFIISAAAIGLVLLSTLSFRSYFEDTELQAINPDTMAFPLPEKPSIAVLPFTDQSEDGAENYFVDGVTEDIVTDLSKLPDVFVIAYRSTRAYKENPKDVGAVAKELGVRYVLRGSMRRDEDNFRINAQLIDAVNGHNVWATRQDGPLGNLFNIQMDLASQIATAMDVKLVSGEMARLRRDGTRNPDAYINLLRGIREARRLTEESNQVARRLFQQALELDPTYMQARLWLARTHVWDVRYGWSKSSEESTRLAEEQASTIEDGNNSVMAVLYTLRGDYEKALAAREATVAREPNSADAQARLGLTLIQSGKPEEAISRFKIAMRLSPQYPVWYLGRLGDAYRLSGQTDEAIAAFRGVIKRRPDDILHGRVRLVTTLATVGRLAEARSEAGQILKIDPSFRVADYMKTRLYRDTSERDQMRDALLLAGLPE